MNFILDNWATFLTILNSIVLLVGRAQGRK